MALKSRTYFREVHTYGNDDIKGGDFHLHGLRSIQEAGYFSVSWKVKLPIRPNAYHKSYDEEQQIIQGVCGQFISTVTNKYNPISSSPPSIQYAASALTKPIRHSKNEVLSQKPYTS
jgi:hypothetical protein